MSTNSETILDVRNLQTSFFTSELEVKAVDGVSFKVPKGKTIGIVGESGSGKSITSLSILRLIQNPGKVVGGEVLFNGENILEKSEAQMRKIRGNDISMIFQEPMTSLNPVYTVGQQIGEAFQIHEKLGKKEAIKKSIDMLKLVGIPSPEKRVHQYPFELSGGMRQRVMIAMALACNPKLLIADEPTTALDVTIQAQILELMKDLQDRLGMSIIMITHDLGVVAETCDYVAVMYCGKVVEYASVKDLFNNPRHPYTVGLLNSLPRHDEDVEGELEIIPGSVPSPAEMPTGCRFAPRCAYASDICKELPQLEEDENGNQIRCWIYSEEWDGDPEVNVYEKRTT
ncbi:peptide ABC transporter ATP-binding protein [Alkalihalobacillus alcalophilus ATCC 27647 = CGMCC 1.3604]|uniref:Dipeptide/oligopeptide transporter n=1 Tax=Alkalihalobacillus alcalophilus ATCC 27647 = CGMCC 1.3604 TaxID=1218173 RepID=J8TN95_ALKAL|nr:ABC transporter ATP-binding protein [Alkalihalobacillus alcalophilus]AFV25949.1 dipeptide/oligopeptide transporter [Alkalihalobacillus alcalophilus ATCC 27647 = CGMCC 1.3604]KGA96141.1 peptide ABC transporter ATP-binding protein [Alkalihalobacillus alcalophilus ATCC 27647 = CGMCC 1.3604]MED1560370.1 ABC transporter ATP-binding protein [Alkalihalobacillus alcalophilus]THG90403.1 peptide ABC transporter ATP-binding protein [Alkalihalobacillus alcalophilus ATCC 27647 = CGMCC 1.3604]